MQPFYLIEHNAVNTRDKFYRYEILQCCYFTQVAAACFIQCSAIRTFIFRNSVYSSFHSQIYLPECMLTGN